MKVAIFSTHSYDETFLNAANSKYGFTLQFFSVALTEQTVQLAQGYDAVCVFVHDELDAPVLKKLAEYNIQLIALRCAGFNNVDIEVAKKFNFVVARVPAYSPYAVAEHSIGMMLALNRKVYRAYNRVREGNFSLDGLLGFDMRDKTVGLVGTGRIGTVIAKILLGFDCKVLACDTQHSETCEAMGVEYVELPVLYKHADIISLHCPLTCDTHHLIDSNAIQLMKQGVMIINTSRGAVVDTQAVVTGLKSGKIGSLGLDVYEQEDELFFKDLSDAIIQDDVFERLLTFPNVLITAHQGFFTHEALTNIAETTLANIAAYPNNIPQQNMLTPQNIINKPCES